MAKQYIYTHSDGDKFYYKDPEMTILHREDGPAIEWVSGNKEWLINGKLHRLDGPALEYVIGYSAQWFVNDVFIFETNRAGRIKDRMEG